MDRWLAKRMERVPEEFRSWLDPEVDEGDDDPGSSPVARDLEDRGLASLQEAVGAPGRNRDSAFHLLAADAYLTWSAEAVVEGSNPESELRDLVRRVAAEAP
ncbi:MAG: hypothetical protein R3223_03795 [Longimicrobiales bacterium]|nr:hypothetical protein [Longimicrobiales bacterium]